MSKKMYDILPPGMVTKAENTVKSPVVASKNKKTKQKEVKKHKKTKIRKFPLKEILIGAAVILFLLAIYKVTKLPKADISIWPKTDTLMLQGTVTLNAGAKAVDLANKVIPARFIEIQKDNVQEFLATGVTSNDGKATGTIKIYNKAGSTLTLVKGTHFLSDSEKYFVTLERAVVPATGSFSVKVEAKESGEDYNIKPSKFSVPKLYGTAYYYSTYGESSSAMSGGYTGTVKQVTEDDIKQAKDSLTQRTLQEARDSLRSKVALDEILLDGAVESIVIDAAADVKAGAIADKFNELVKVKTSALVFKKQDVEKFIKDNILAQIPETDSLLQESLQIEYNPQVLNTKEQTLPVILKSSAKTYYNINTEELIILFKTKSSDQIKQVVDQMYSGKINKLKIDFWPFWVKKAPDNKNRIKVDLLFNN